MAKQKPIPETSWWSRMARLRSAMLSICMVLPLVLTACGAGDTGSTPGSTDSSVSDDVVVTLSHDGLARSYLLHVPPSYTEGQPIPLVINLHGGGANPELQRHSSQMNLKADQAEFIVAYPAGTGRMVSQTLVGTFNAGRCCGLAKEQNVDDVGFIEYVIDDISSRFSVDRLRVFATGHSNGALMTYRLACELSDRIAAIAPNAAHDAFDNCRPTRPVPVIHFHGTADPAASFNGGQCGGNSNDPGWACGSVPDYMAGWRLINSCTELSDVVYDRGDAQCRSWSQCSVDSEVQLCEITGGGHTWPGGEYSYDSQAWKNLVGHLSTDISANDAMWDFFRRHPMQE